jgi:hypothetical protein
MTTGAGKSTSPGSTPRHPRPGIAVLEVVPYLDDIALGVLDVDREIAARVLDGATPVLLARATSSPKQRVAAHPWLVRQLTRASATVGWPEWPAARCAALVGPRARF